MAAAGPGAAAGLDTLLLGAPGCRRPLNCFLVSEIGHEGHLALADYGPAGGHHGSALLPSTTSPMPPLHWHRQALSCHEGVEVEVEREVEAEVEVVVDVVVEVEVEVVVEVEVEVEVDIYRSPV